MPPTIIVTVGRLAFELELEPLPPLAPAAAVEEELPDEQAATLRAATHAAAASPKYGFLRNMDVLLDVL
jgi:hypothetical protein